MSPFAYIQFMRSRNFGGFWLSVGLPVTLMLAFVARQMLNFNSIGWTNGFNHPLSGWDHLLTMLAVGIWAAQLRGRAIWLLPLAFVGVMSLGGLAGAAGLALPNLEGIILLSGSVFGVLISRKIRFNNKINVLIVAFFGFCHGYAHGQEISTSASLLSYTLGFMLATLLLHGAGILVAKLVVLAIGCLFSVLFSTSALAKSAESVIDIKLNPHLVVDQSYFDGYGVGCAERSDAHQSRTMHLQSRHILWYCRQNNVGQPLIHQFQDSVNAGYNYQPRCHKATCIDYDDNQANAKDFISQDSGGGLLAGTAQFSSPVSALVNRQSISHQGKQNSALGDYHTVTVKDFRLTAGENAINQLFYPSYCADCSNLDFKNYFPIINHTPGRHFLSNGVGLTSPPDLFSISAVSRQFQNNSFSLIAASSLQLSLAGFPNGNSVIKSPVLLKRDELSLAISLIWRPFVQNIRNANDFNSFSRLFNAGYPLNSSSTANINNFHWRSVTLKIPLFAEFADADQPIISFAIQQQSVRALYKTNNLDH